MKTWFYNLSIKNKITSIIVLTVFLVLSIGFGGGYYSETRSIKERMLAEKILTAKIVSSYTIADLAFDNKETAHLSLSYLKNDKSILNAHVYDAKQQHFVSLYSNNHHHNLINNKAKTFITTDTNTQYVYTSLELHIIEPIYLEGKQIGSFHLHASTQDYLRNLKEITFYLLLFLILLLVIALFIAGKLSTIVTKPLLSLSEIAGNISKHADYNFQIQAHYKDETGTLINSFNTMIKKIAIRESERDKAEQQLKDNEKNLELILNNMVDCVLTIDDSGKVLTINKSAEQLFGYQANEIIGNNIKKLIPDSIQLLEKHLSYSTHEVKSRLIENNCELVATRNNQANFTMRLSIVNLPQESDKHKRFILSCLDLTELKQQEERNHRTQKMDALGKLTGGIAHDFNNMLGVVSGYSELLSSALENSTNDKLFKYSQQIHHASERGAKLTKKLLAFSKKQTSEAKNININTILQDEQHMLEKTLTVRIKLVLKLADDLWPVHLDSNDLEDAILNMSINAMHAIKTNGQLTIETKNLHHQGTDSQILDLKVGDYVCLSMTDTGCGMDDETKKRIFDPFYTTKGDKGTGLGLSQVYGFVKRSQGSIKVYTESGHGTRFTLYFPRVNEPHDKLQQTNLHQEMVQNKLNGNETILLVDDEKSLLHMTKEMLIQYGYQIYTANSAREALILLSSTTIDLVLSDVVMPEMDGYQLAEQIQELYPHIKIQLASGFSDDRHIKAKDDSLHKNLLIKPLSVSTLLHRLRRLLDE
ncbi:MAG: response regulator [Gammaproteobacteria bacterium]|nr:response regulator [Gammaproteobacteria bacterium]